MEDKPLRKKVHIFLSILFLLPILTSCKQDEELVVFRNKVDTFCVDISNIDTAINDIDPNSETAIDELLGYLDELDLTFQQFAAITFPDEFDYLQELAVESSQNMTDAVNSYHEAYSNGSYNEYTAAYAQEYYSRAYKRIQIIITFLHGEEPDDPDLTIEYSSEETN
jgi:hypothetical protein